jgi:hypothetical protein
VLGVMLQNVLKAAGRYEFEGEFRRWLTLPYINVQFKKSTNDIEDIPLHHELKMYFDASKSSPQFNWVENMDDHRLKVSLIKITGAQ